VIIDTDRFLDQGVSKGSLGYIIERWPDGALEVEVMRPDGSTTAQFVAQPSELHRAGAEGRETDPGA
jgi:hypothetical protein